jgi:hypothetical protein
VPVRDVHAPARALDGGLDDRQGVLAVDEDLDRIAGPHRRGDAEPVVTARIGTGIGQHVRPPEPA